MSGAQAILVLQKAREIAGRTHFWGSRAEAVRLACIDLDASPEDALILLRRVVPPERLLARVDEQGPRVFSVTRRQRQFLDRMQFDFDAAIQGLLDVVRSRRSQIAVAAATDADNWAGQSAEEKDRKFFPIFEKAVAEHGARMPRPVKPSLQERLRALPDGLSGKLIK